MTEPAYLIAIGGCSCSGKTTLAHFLAKGLDGTVLPIDAYYKDLSGLDPKSRLAVNFDEPEAIEFDLLLRDIRRLAGGKIVHRPVYDFTTHTRTGRTAPAAGGGFLILEGLFALYWAELRSLCRTKVYLDLPEELCLERRLTRDVEQRGRTPDSVRRQLEGSVFPMARRHIVPTRRCAHIVMSGVRPLEEAEALLQRIRSQGGV